MDTDYVIEMLHITKEFPGIRANDDVTLQLRRAGVAAERDLCERSVKAQMKYADKLGARYTVVLGDDEIASGMVHVRNMKTGEQCDCKLEADAITAAIAE